MHLAHDRFSQSTFCFRHEGRTIEGTRYTYETHAGLFDIDVYPELATLFKVNMRFGTFTAIHRQIIRHFLQT